MVEEGGGEGGEGPPATSWMTVLVLWVVVSEDGFFTCESTWPKCREGSMISRTRRFSSFISVQRGRVVNIVRSMCALFFNLDSGNGRGERDFRYLWTGLYCTCIGMDTYARYPYMECVYKESRRGEDKRERERGKLPGNPPSALRSQSRCFCTTTTPSPAPRSDSAAWWSWTIKVPPVDGCRATSPREVEKVERSSWANFMFWMRACQKESGRYISTGERGKESK